MLQAWLLEFGCYYKISASRHQLMFETYTYSHKDDKVGLLQFVGLLLEKNAQPLGQVPDKNIYQKGQKIEPKGQKMEERQKSADRNEETGIKKT